MVNHRAHRSKKLPLPFERLTNLSVPLVCNPSSINKFQVISIKVTAKITYLKSNDLRLEASTYAIYLSTENIRQDKLILPFCIKPESVRCRFQEENETIEILADVSSVKMEDGPDVGSRPWTLVNALSIENTSEESKILGGSNNLNQKEKNTIEDTIEKEGCRTGEAKNEFPEDKFHDKDAMSQYMMKLQEEERKSKTDKFDRERMERESSIGQNPDINVDLIDADDFKPGGKYFQQKVVEKASKDEDDCKKKKPEITNIILQKAESMMRDSTEVCLTSDLWSTLL